MGWGVARLLALQKQYETYKRTYYILFYVSQRSHKLRH